VRCRRQRGRLREAVRWTGNWGSPITQDFFDDYSGLGGGTFYDDLNTPHQRSSGDLTSLYRNRSPTTGPETPTSCTAAWTLPRAPGTASNRLCQEWQHDTTEPTEATTEFCRMMGVLMGTAPLY
jgi:hypothetical protein